MVQRCGVGGAQEEEQYLVCSSTKRALALKTQQALTSQHSGEERCRRRARRRWRRECCVWPLARGLTSGWEIPHGDSGHEPVSCRRCGRPRARAKPCTMHTLRGLELNLYAVTSIRRYRARVTVTGQSPDGPAVRSGLRTRVRGNLSARRGRGERRGSELDVRVRSRGGLRSGSPDADGRRRNNTIRAERPSSVTNPQGLACTGSKKQLLHAIDNALG
jgi:hypothetical protein